MVVGGVLEGRSCGMDGPAAALAAEVLAQELPGLRVDEPHDALVPLRVDLAADPAGRRRVVRALDLDAAVEVHGPLAEGVVAKGLDRQRLQRRLLLGEHRRDLALRRAVDPRVGPPLLPAIQVRLRLLERLEAHAP